MENLWKDFLNFIRQRGVVVPEPKQMGHVLNQQIASQPSTIFKTPIYETITYKFKNKRVRESFVVVNASFRGMISDMYIYVPNTDGNNKLFSSYIKYLITILLKIV